MDETLSKSVGLGGDGDEVCAIDDVERTFGVKLDYADASQWVTAGDLFASLQKSLPEAERSRPDLWKRFAASLCGQTGVNPDLISQDSPLLSKSRFWARLADVSAAIWIVVFVGFLILIVAALI
jgi:hypothetical protein